MRVGPHWSGVAVRRAQLPGLRSCSSFLARISLVCWVRSVARYFALKKSRRVER